ncbi:hypothetical protein M973_00340 [Francisella orientalis LADL 07-285A]|nr:hypothetical protein M973_00340 [Francisella orientalis LADL 07-285A]
MCSAFSLASNLSSSSILLSKYALILPSGFFALLRVPAIGYIST